MLKRISFFAYGVISYAIFFASFLYAIGFVGNFLTPTTLDAAPTGSTAMAVLINLGLLTVFAVQHSVMARPWFKRMWTKFMPEVIERSTYVLLSSILMFVLYWQWRPLGGEIWSVTDPTLRAAVYSVYGLGWALLLLSTFLLNHFDLFGLRQVWLQLIGREYMPVRFGTPFLYRVVRHPLYVGWLTIFWATPTMTSAHLLFALMTTAYILVAIQFEERDLIVDMGSGMILGVKTVDSHPQAVLDLLATATTDLFEGKTVTKIEDIFKKARGVKSDERYFQEILVASTNLWHYFGRSKDHPNIVTCVVTRTDVNIGMLLMKSREICGAVAV